MSEGAEWLAQENKRLAERVSTLEGKLREATTMLRKLADEKEKLGERNERLSARHWSFRVSISEALGELERSERESGD